MRRNREAQQKARAQQLLSGKLQSMVVKTKPPLPPAAMEGKREVGRREEGRREEVRREEPKNVPVIRPFLVKKGESMEERERPRGVCE